MGKECQSRRKETPRKPGMYSARADFHPDNLKMAGAIDTELMPTNMELTPHFMAPPRHDIDSILEGRYAWERTGRMHLQEGAQREDGAQ